MADMPTPADIKEFVSLLAPGAIILWVRSKIDVSQTTDLQEKVLQYALVSAVYYAFASPLFSVSSGVSLPGWAWRSIQYFAFPFAIGLASAYWMQSGLTYWLSGKARLSLTHHISSAWDYGFGRKMNVSRYVLVTLKDGSTVCGEMDHNSMASSNSQERDLFIGKMFEIDSSTNSWTMITPPRSILITGNDIRTVEIFE